MELLPFLSFFLLVLFSPVINAQAAPNTLNGIYPNLQTMSVNASMFIIPMDRTTVAGLIGNYNLLTIANNDLNFPGGFPSGKHPVLITPGGYVFDVHMGVLYVDNLIQASVVIPYVDGANDGKTPCTYSYLQFMSGIVPSVGSTLFFGTTLLPGIFDPSNTASKFVPPSFFSNKVSFGNPNLSQLFPCLLSFFPTPTTQLEALSAQFSIVQTQQYPLSTYSNLLNFPLISNQGSNNCLVYKYFLDTPTANPLNVTGTITTYSPFLPKQQNNLLGLFTPTTYTFSNVPGLSANAQAVNCGQDTCANIAALPPSTVCLIGLQTGVIGV